MKRRDEDWYERLGDIEIRGDGHFAYDEEEAYNRLMAEQMLAENEEVDGGK